MQNPNLSQLNPPYLNFTMNLVIGTLIQMLLSQNMEVQEEKVKIEEIVFFSKLMSERDMSDVFLTLMEACCICRGRGMTPNQVKTLLIYI